MEAIIRGLVGDNTLLSVTGAVVITIVSIFLMMRGKGNETNPGPVTPVDLLTMRREIEEEQSDSRRKIYDSIASIHNQMDMSRSLRDQQMETVRNDIHKLDTRLAVVETIQGRRR